MELERRWSKMHAGFGSSGQSLVQESPKFQGNIKARNICQIACLEVQFPAKMWISELRKKDSRGHWIPLLCHECMHTDTHLGPKKNAQIKNEWKKIATKSCNLKSRAGNDVLYIYIKKITLKNNN
jgi:hypothetical protein